MVAKAQSEPSNADNPPPKSPEFMVLVYAPFGDVAGGTGVVVVDDG